MPFNALARKDSISKEKGRLYQAAL